MADLEDLKYPSISDMSNDEAIDLLRQMRLSRRTPDKKTKTTIKAKAKPIAMDANLAEQLLKILGGTE